MTRTQHLFMLGVAVSAMACSPWASVRWTALPGADGPQAVSRCRLGSAANFAILLKNLDIDAVLAADPDVIVVDWTSGSNACGELDAAQVARLRSRPGHVRGDRIVLARLDIGKTDAVRAVFRAGEPGGTCLPALMIPIDPVLGEGVAPKPDSAAWKAALCDGADSAVSRISSLGFDGVYVEGLARGVADLLPDQAAAIKMVGLFRAVVDAFRRLDPDFIVVPVDPAGILGGPGIDDALSGMAFHGAMFRDGYILQESGLKAVLHRMNAMRAKGIPVLAVEFVDDGIQASHFAAICRDMGYLCYDGLPDFNHLEPLINAGNGSGCR